MNPWPKNPVLAFVAGAWSSPVTALGLALALVSWPLAWWAPGARNGTLRFVAARSSPLAWAIRVALGADWAMTVGALMLSTAPVTDPRWESHENRHVRQAFALGALIVPVWALSGLVFGYTDSVLEVDARAHEQA